MHGDERTWILIALITTEYAEDGFVKESLEMKGMSSANMKEDSYNLVATIVTNVSDIS